MKNLLAKNPHGDAMRCKVGAAKAQVTIHADDGHTHGVALVTYKANGSSISKVEVFFGKNLDVADLATRGVLLRAYRESEWRIALGSWYLKRDVPAFKKS